MGDSAEIAGRVGAAHPGAVRTATGLVTPGFMDGHLHFLDGGFQLASVDLRPAESPEDFIARLGPSPRSERRANGFSAATGTTSAGPARRCPARQWIDSVTPNNPVFVYRLDGHMALANSAALRLAGIIAGHAGTFRAGSSCATGGPASRRASSRTRR